jgi:hypothetical protein
VTSRFRRDKLQSLPPKRVAQSALRALNAVQFDEPELQVAGLAAAFYLLAKRFGVHAGDPLETIARILNSNEGRKTDLRAVQLYVENEL